jgi:hypothetical protein
MLCVLYLAWAPLGPEPVERFVDSYLSHPAQAPHTLLIGLKGFTADQDRSPWLTALGRVEHQPLELAADVLDLGSYREAVQSTSASHYCFVNTETVVMADGWLGHLEHNLLAPGVGIVGATGSFETPNRLRPGPLRALRPGYPSFPNPAVRTNGFALERELLLSLRWPITRTKLDAVALECGERGITRQLLRRGLQALVVGRDGRGYPPQQWRASSTFRSGEQANLMLADKRTRHYDGAARPTRRMLEWLAWGSRARVAVG